MEASYWAYMADKINYGSQGREFRQAFAALQRSFALNTYLQVLEYFADQFYHNIHDHHPDIKDPLSHIMYGRIAQALAVYDSAWMEKALESYRQGLEEYPQRSQLIEALARAYLRVGVQKTR